MEINYNQNTMKSFSLLIACLFCVTIVSAQKIPESTFKKQLENKQKELYETVDKKEKLSAEIATLENEIKAEKDETKKKSKIEKKVALEKQEKTTKEKIVAQCNDYREYRMFLKKHQDVSQEYLDKFKVRVCDFYTDATAENEKYADGAEKILKEKQEEIAKLEQEIAASNAEVATAQNDVNTTENKIKDEGNENDREILRKQLETKKATLQNKRQVNENLIFKIKSKCQDFSNYKKLLKEKYNVEDVILEAYKVPNCALQVQKPIASAEETNDAKKEIEKRIVSIDALVELKKEIEQKVIAQAGDVKKLEVEISLEKDEDKLEKLKEQLEAAKKINRELVRKNDETLALIQSSCKEFEAYKKFLKKEKNIDAAVVDAYASEKCSLYAEEAKRDTKKFVIVGDNKPVKFDSLFSNSSTRQIIADVFSIDSRTNLGTFEIPGDNTFINFFGKKKVSNFLGIKNNEAKKFKKVLVTNEVDEKDESYAISVKQYKMLQDVSTQRPEEELEFFEEVPEGALFKSIQIELREGGIVDARLVLHSVDGKFEFYFEGTAPVSILHYARKASKRSFLKYSHYVSLDGKGVYNENALKRLLVRYTDVLDYHPNAGSNYVPDDVSYKFPSDITTEANETGRRSYQVINDNHLQHVLDLRAYTDLLGLFGDQDNGLFQIEGKADFFIHPFNFPRTGLYYLKKVSPYVRYSRFDEESDFVAAKEGETVTNDDGTMTTEYLLSDRKLRLLERSNLEMGLDFNLINFRWFKESPLWTSIYFPLSYNVTKVRTDLTTEDNDANYKTLGFGFGANLEIRRFNNFGLNLGYELKGHSFIGDYSEFGIEEPGYLKTQAVKAEIFYYPGVDRSNSIFLRMKSVRDIGSGGGDTFFQLQVGYRFTVGVGAIKARQ